jgi:aminopeptidase N
MEAHEVAHQWWGNVVTTAAYQDEWLLEALASYSALLWLEKKKGPKVVEGVLEDYRDRLLAKSADGRTVESAGPIIWGTRLNSAGIPDAWRAITYEKGAWILHMLRRRIGDERFLKLLAELRRRYEFQPITTDEFRELAKEFLPPKTSAAMLDAFFDNWVYATGVPTLKLQYWVKGVAPALKLSGTITQSGVDDDFSIEAPVEIQLAKGPPQIVWVRTSNESVPFSVALKQPPLRVTVPSGTGVLASKK